MVALKRLAERAPLDGGRLVIDASGLDALDTAGVWVVRRLIQRADTAGSSVEVVGLRDDYQALL
ncbi:MAG: phospholipid/cholesterol/gamma-HCH transport system permease protein, partial [Bradymonadia bacterium]